jgi:hypothetical protein
MVRMSAHARAFLRSLLSKRDRTCESDLTTNVEPTSANVMALGGSNPSQADDRSLSVPLGDPKFVAEFKSGLVSDLSSSGFASINSDSIGDGMTARHIEQSGDMAGYSRRWVALVSRNLGYVIETPLQ